MVVVLALAGVVAAPAGADGGPAETLKQKKKALGQVQRQLREERARATEAHQRELSLLGELERMERSLGQKRAELSRLDRRIQHLQLEVDRLTGQRARVAEDRVAHHAWFTARLRALARLRHAPTVPAWLGDQAELTRRRAVEALGQMARRDLERLVEFGETAERLGARQAAVDRTRRQVVKLRRTVETERAALDAEAGRRRALLARVREDRATYEQMVAELKAAGRRLEALVQELARRVQVRRVVAPSRAPHGSPPPAVGLGTLRGRLPWPTEGRVVAGFGRQVHPRFGTETFRRGVDIEAAEGAPIRAVYAGTVVYRGWVRGYGNLIILDHGDGYYTLYAHVSEFLVEEGQRVRAGQRIARVGETGSLAGPRLYFEVRYQGRAQDPEKWLKRRL